MSEIQALLEQGARPRGQQVHHLADALLCVAAHDDDYDREQRVGLVAGLLLPHTPWRRAISDYFDVAGALHFPAGEISRDARIRAHEVASNEITYSTQVAPAATYEGKHRNGT